MKNPNFTDIRTNLFEWSDDYKIGISEIDNQHKKLFAMAYELNKAMLERKANDILEKLLNDLMTYTQTHFQEETNHA